MKRYRTTLLGPLFAMTMLGGCMVGPDYHRPSTPLPLHYKELTGWDPARPADLDAKGSWWAVYRDPLLDALERRVLASNQNIKSFAAQYDQALAIEQEARGQLFPTLAANTGVTHGSGGSGSGHTTGTQYTVEATGSWDLDVWGRIRRQVQSDAAAAQVSAADLQNATLSAQGSLADDYVQLRYDDSLTDLLQATVRSYEAALRITANQVSAGTTSPADQAEALTQLAGARAALINVGVTRGQYEHAIAVLAGVPPTDVTIAAAALATDVPVVPPGLPATLLQRRPDIAAAERMMDEENALIGVQVAAFYPDVSLSADFGWQGGPIGVLFTVANRVWSLGANATETIFEGGARTAAVRAARDAYDGSVAQYRQIVLGALQQVEDDLVALRVLEQQATAEATAVQAAQRSVAIALNQYEAGTTAYTAVVTEQTALLNDQQAALSIQEQRLQASVALIQALGGGWTDRWLPPSCSAGACR